MVGCCVGVLLVTSLALFFMIYRACAHLCLAVSAHAVHTITLNQLELQPLRRPSFIIRQTDP